jgi:hypothetical protein
MSQQILYLKTANYVLSLPPNSDCLAMPFGVVLNLYILKTKRTTIMRKVQEKLII